MAEGGSLQNNDGSDQVPICGMCTENISDGHCGDCESHMCQSCFDLHLNIRACRYHVLRDDFEPPTANSKTNAEPCKIHENQIIEFFCVVHRNVGCAKCMLTDHSTCKREDINVAAKRFHGSEDDTRLSQNMQTVETLYTACMQKVLQLTQTLAATNDKTVNDIETFKASVSESVDETVRAALAEAEHLRLESENKIERLSVFLKKIGNSMGLFKDTLNNRDELEKVFIAAMDIEPKLAEYQESLSSLKTKHITAAYTFQPQETLLNMMRDSMLLGKVVQETGAPDATEEEDQPEQNYPLHGQQGMPGDQGLPQAPVVSYISQAIGDQKGMEEKIAQSTTQPVDEEQDRHDDSSGEEDQPEPDDGAEQLVPKLIVTNIPSTVDVEYIEWFFERKRNFGGLDVMDIVYNEEDACAIVEFGSSEDIDAVLEKVPIKMKGKEVEVQRYEPEPEEPIDPCTVLVSGPEAVISDIETLEYYFESKKRSDGGDIADIKYEEDLNVVVISFEEEEDAQRVIEKTDHKVKKQAITVEQYKPMSRKPAQREHVVSDDDYEDAEEVIVDTVKISGVNDSIRSTAELYFENPKRSGGGDYDDCWSDPDEEGVIYIKFNNPEDALKVLERDHEVKGTRLTVELYVKVTATASKPLQRKSEPVPEPDEEIIYDTVKVVGVDPSKRRTVELYFENTQRSGGGEYQTIWSDEEEEGVIYIKYCTEEVAKAVANRSHRVEKCELKVKLYTPPKPPPSYDNKILIKGLKETTSQDGLFNFIEAKSGFIPESVDYHETEPGIVMVTFESKPDFNKLESIFQKYKLEGSSLKLAPVAISNCIMVSELPERITQDTVHFYFENQRKSGGGDVDKVTMNDDDTYLVYFVDYTVIDSVLVRKHTLSKQTVVVQRYQECLGRPEGDVKDRKLKIPEPIVLKDVDINKVKYLNKSDTNKRTLEGQLQAVHCKVCWPNEGEDVKLECTLSQSVDGCFRLAKTWKKDVLAVIEAYMGNIVVVKTEVLQDAWKNVLQKLGEITIDDPESLALYIGPQVYPVLVKEVMDEIKKLKKL